MKFKKILTSGLLAGAMLALPMTAPAFAEPAYSANSNYVERVNWWHHDDDDGYAYRNRGYYGNGYYGNRYYGNRYYGYSNRYGYGYGRRGYGYGGYGACANAQRLQNQARRDRWTGHPAAASDVAEQAAWARRHCYR
jgi:hypothetical protein